MGTIKISARTFLVIGIVLLCFSCNRKTPNLVNNPGFETGNGDNPDGWVISSPRNFTNFIAGLDENESRSGKRSYKISWPSHIRRVSITLSKEEPIAIDPQKNYILSFWYRTNGFNDYPRAGSASFRVICEETPSVRYSKAIYTSDRWKHYHILLDNMPHDANNLELSFSASVNTEGTIWFDDIEFREATGMDVAFFERWRRQPVPEITGGAGNRSFEATGLYRVEKTDDRWWLIDPEGNPTWAIANSATLGSTDRPVSQTEWFRTRFGTTSEEIYESMYNIFVECGFNSLAGWSHDIYGRISKERAGAGQPYMPMTRVLGLNSALRDPGAYARDRDGNLKDRSGHQVPDPFNPHWRRAARERAEETIPAYRDEPWFLGWYVSNEMDFTQLYRYIWAGYSSREFIKRLESRYKTIDALNKAWTSPLGSYQYASFNEILADKPEPVEWDDPLWADFAEFERHMMKEYIDFTIDLVRELDPGRLIISNRINLGPMPEIYRTIDLYAKYDIVCMNIYPDNNRIGFKPGELEIMKKLYEGTGRPIMIGEWSVPAIDSDLYAFGEDPLGRPLDWSWPQVLRTQKERGEAYDICIKQLASLDFMIGAHWFITFDVDTPERRSNRGLMNRDFQLYRDLTDAMTKANYDIKRDLGIKW
jgi:hypothetical protein